MLAENVKKPGGYHTPKCKVGERIAKKTSIYAFAMVKRDIQGNCVGHCDVK
jgi:hypothetical protein